jgi:hypothetical protein
LLLQLAQLSGQRLQARRACLAGHTPHSCRHGRVLLAEGLLQPHASTARPGGPCKPLLHVLLLPLLLWRVGMALGCCCWRLGLLCMLLQEAVAQASQLVQVIRVEQL